MIYIIVSADLDIAFGWELIEQKKRWRFNIYIGPLMIGIGYEDNDTE